MPHRVGRTVIYSESSNKIEVQHAEWRNGSPVSVSANGAPPRLFECDVCTADIALRTRRQHIDSPCVSHDDR
jgi:hypothetical protein